MPSTGSCQRGHRGGAPARPQAPARADLPDRPAQELARRDGFADRHDLARRRLAGGGAPSTLYDVAQGDTLYMIDTDGSGYDLLHSFSSATDDGENPYGSLTLGGSTLYGMTVYGGANDEGVIFKIDTDGKGYNMQHASSFARSTRLAGTMR